MYGGDSPIFPGSRDSDFSSQQSFALGDNPKRWSQDSSVQVCQIFNEPSYGLAGQQLNHVSAVRVGLQAAMAEAERQEAAKSRGGASNGRAPFQAALNEGDEVRPSLKRRRTEHHSGWMRCAAFAASTHV